MVIAHLRAEGSSLRACDMITEDKCVLMVSVFFCYTRIFARNVVSVKDHLELNLIK